MKDNAKVIERLAKVEITVFRWDPSFGEKSTGGLPQPVTRRHVAEKLWKQASFLVYPEDIRILGRSAIQSAVGDDENEIFGEAQSVAEAAASFRAEQEEEARVREEAKRAAEEGGVGDDDAASSVDASAAAKEQRSSIAFDRVAHANKAVDRAWEEATGARSSADAVSGKGAASPSSEQMQAKLRQRFIKGGQDHGDDDDDDDDAEADDAEKESEDGDAEEDGVASADATAATANGDEGDDDDTVVVGADADDEVFTKECAAAATEKAKSAKKKKKKKKDAGEDAAAAADGGFGDYDVLVRCSAEGDVAPIKLRILRLNESRTQGGAGAADGGMEGAAAAMM